MSGDATAARRPGRARVGALGVPRTRLLDDRDALQQMEHFGVLHDQIRHDFAISHVLAAIAPHREHFIFYGGTALSRSILDGLRLSEDIDLLSCGPRRVVADLLDDAICTALERTFGRIEANPPLNATRQDTDACIYRVGDADIRIQLIDGRDYTKLPQQTTGIHQRYSGMAELQLTTYTPAGFVVAKTMAWCDRTRNAPRDLYDLWALARDGHIDAEAAQIYRRFGPTGDLPERWLLPPTAPSEKEWFTSLNHQCIPRVGPAEAHRMVLDAWAQAVDVAR